MKLINIPGLCAIPKLYDQVVDLFTPEPSEEELALQAELAALTVTVKEFEKANEKVTIKVDLPEDVINDLAKQASNNTRAEKHEAQLDEEDSNWINETWSFTPAADVATEEPKYQPPKFADPVQHKVSTMVGDGDIDDRLNKSIGINLASRPNSIKTTPVKAKRKTAKKPRKNDMSILTTADWDLIRLRDKQRIVWNQMHPDQPKRTRQALVKSLQKEIGTNKGYTNFSNIMVTTSKHHTPRSDFPDREDGFVYDTGEAVHVTDFKDIKKLYEED